MNVECSYICIKRTLILDFTDKPIITIVTNTDPIFNLTTGMYLIISINEN